MLAGRGALMRLALAWLTAMTRMENCSNKNVPVNPLDKLSVHASFGAKTDSGNCKQ